MSVSLNKGLNALREQINAPVASFFTTCVHCGMCAHACPFYTETGDPKYTPISKLDPMRRLWKQEYTFWGKLMSTLGLSKPVTDEELTEWEPLVYDSCTMCGRCTMVCPVGNDIVYMIRKMREGMVAAGHAPEGLKGATIRAVEIGSPMGVTLATLQAQMKHAAKDTGLEIPIDREGVDCMVLMSGAEVAQFPEYLSSVARIFDHAGVTWTLASDAFEATNSGIQIGSTDIAAELVGRIVAAAERLKVKRVISPECGHAYVALRWEGPNLIGRSYPFEVMHILELLDELRAQGRLKTEGTRDDRLTFHDPCQLVRRGGVIDPPRRLLKMVTSNFVDMEDAGTMNWCCGGGGGVSANPRAEPVMLKAFDHKKEQLNKTGARTLVTACSNCRNVLMDGLDHNNMDIEVTGLTEIIADHLVTSSATKPAGEQS